MRVEVLGLRVEGQGFRVHLCDTVFIPTEQNERELDYVAVGPVDHPSLSVGMGSAQWSTHGESKRARSTLNCRAKREQLKRFDADNA